MTRETLLSVCPRSQRSERDRSSKFGYYKRLFLNPIDRSTHYCRYKGKWFNTGIPLKDTLFHDHLSGKITIGYKAQSHGSGCIAFDIDNHGRDQTQVDTELHALVATIKDICGALPIIEQSIKNGGYHVYIPLMNGKYAEYGDKIRLFVAWLQSKARVKCEVYSAGCRIGNFRAPLSSDYRLIDPLAGTRTELTGYNAIGRIITGIEQGVYIANYAIKLERIPAQIKQGTAHKGIDKHALQTALLFKYGLTETGQRIRSLSAIYAYLTDYMGNTPEYAVMLLEQWIQTKHNGKSFDINDNYHQGIRSSHDYIRELPKRQQKYTGTQFYWQNMTGYTLSHDAVLLINHLLNLVHYCSISCNYSSSTGTKHGRQYLVSIPYSRTARARFDGFKDKKTGTERRYKAELELERYGLIYRDPQTKVFLPHKRFSDPCTHMCINVSALFGYRSGFDIRTKYKDKFCDKRSQEFLREAKNQYTQTEIANILGVSQQTISKWIKYGKIPVRHQIKLYELGQI